MLIEVRLLANLKEIEEPFEKDQIGSSAMAYKVSYCILYLVIELIDSETPCDVNELARYLDT